MYQKMQVSGLTEIIRFICISAIWGHILFFLSAHQREQLQPNGCPAAGIIFLPGCPEWLESLMTVTFLFIDMAGNTPFLKIVPIFMAFCLHKNTVEWLLWSATYRWGKGWSDISKTKNRQNRLWNQIPGTQSFYSKVTISTKTASRSPTK